MYENVCDTFIQTREHSQECTKCSKESSKR